MIHSIKKFDSLKLPAACANRELFFLFIHFFFTSDAEHSADPFAAALGAGLQLSVAEHELRVSAIRAFLNGEIFEFDPAKRIVQLLHGDRVHFLIRAHFFVSFLYALLCGLYAARGGRAVFASGGETVNSHIK